ncbi:NAD(P)H-hydrate epimerase [Halomicrobium sp. LC1Hm]|uniref:NAD(P)H-hydrate epimerase n=1 Tax=Halomicrobium sp. LC1Hm TaxID=2610902 RepID=UPI0012984C8B|nr:NAD(P)H-hydrate epimerase [Halomicrobium sp. LC1Hm]QGA84076.1 NAD(P)H-hydrate epimerase [Halomicrobium sp. LC1Hm]
MDTDAFQTPTGRSVTAVTAEEMRAVDGVAVDDFGISLLQMMEHAGRNLAAVVRADEPDSVVVLAGNGGNGGGGLCAARHLANRNVPVSVVLDRPPEGLDGAARTQYETLAAMGVSVDSGETALDQSASVTVVDALIGYGLDGALKGTAADLVERVGDGDTHVVSLDVPSGVNATTGERAGPAVDPDRVVTLALPKTGLTGLDARVTLADIGIPAGVYASLDIPYSTPFDDEYWIDLSW